MVDPIGTLIGGAALSAFFSVLFDRVTTQQFLKLFEREGLDHTLLERLKTIVMMVHTMLNDAEEMHLTNPSVKNWTDELKEVIYHAEDLVDEIYYSSLARNTGVGYQWSNKSTPNYKDRIEGMISRLEKIAKQRYIFDKMEKSIVEKTSPRVPTISLVDKSKTFGREEEKESMIRFLVNDRATSEIPLIAIWGMLGVGKTTLAQLVYNDPIVMNQFSHRVWVHVSCKFDVVKVCGTILGSFASQYCNIQDLDLIKNQLHQLQQNLKISPKLLLVLDDVWNEDCSSWDTLRSILGVMVHKGSRIIVTTRNKGVVSTMHASFTLPLKELSDEHCWSIFETQAFEGVDKCNLPKLKHIREKIMKKCQGLPLVAKVLGSLLYSKVEAHEWEAILKTRIWDLPREKTYLLASLGLSYRCLSYNLKQCFAYCSLFPKGFILEKEKLILLWKAEGFLPPVKYKTMEEMGSQYFDELVSRSFIQLVCRAGKSCFIMHDLINEFAQFVSNESCFQFEVGRALDVSHMIHRFSYVQESFDPSYSLFEDLHKIKCLRTLLPVSFAPLSLTNDKEIDSSVLRDLLAEQSKLRVLSLFNHHVRRLSDNLGTLIHLRYLDFSYNPIRILPNSTCLLFNLETLILSYCKKLVELPTNMGNLINLGYVDLRETNSLKMMPPAFGSLERLQTLTNFVVSNGTQGSSISELGNLLHLCGELSISELQEVKDDIDAENANLKDKENLKGLVFIWDRNAICDINKDTVVFEKLQPHVNIEKFSINGYSGMKLPDWSGESSYSNMAFLYISGCKNCTSLPSLGQLSSLEELCVEEMDSLEYLGSEFHGHVDSFSVASFESLRILKFANLPNWKEWVSTTIAGEQFFTLCKLDLENCENLTGTLPSYLPALEELYIKECGKLKFPCDGAITYKKLRILKIERSCDMAWDFELDCFDMLEDLYIDDCKGLNYIRVSKDSHQAIKKLEVRNCKSFFAFERFHTPNLMTLIISHCMYFVRMPERMQEVLTSLQVLRISSCPELKSFPGGGLPSNLQSLSIEGCSRLTPNDAWGLSNMVSLTHLTIVNGGRNMKSFPAKGLLPVSLISLVFGGFLDLEILDLNGLQLLSSLQTMEIMSCSDLKSMSAGRLPSSLSSLTISGCWKLTLRCREGGEDSHKISHIKDKIINNEPM